MFPSTEWEEHRPVCTVFETGGIAEGGEQARWEKLLHKTVYLFACYVPQRALIKLGTTC